MIEMLYKLHARLLKKNSFHFAECSNYSYGPGCNQTCGQYLDDLPCHHVNGSCLEGCAPGFEREDCKTGKVFLYIHKLRKYRPICVFIFMVGIIIFSWHLIAVDILIEGNWHRFYITFSLLISCNIRIYVFLFDFSHTNDQNF